MIFFFIKLQKGLKNVFDEAILAALEPPEQKPRRRCCLFWFKSYKKLYHNHHQYIEKKEQSLEIFAVSYTAAHHTNLPNFSVKIKTKTSKKFYSLSTPPLSLPGNVLPTNSNCDSYNLIYKKDENTFTLVLHNCRRNFLLCWKK